MRFLTLIAHTILLLILIFSASMFPIRYRPFYTFFASMFYLIASKRTHARH